MLKGHRIAVVVPAHNEARLIGRTLSDVPSWVDDIIVVDDGSTDDTSEQVCGCEDSRVRLVRHARNTGVGGALATGYRLAFQRGADVAAVMAGDAQMHPADLQALIKPVLDGSAHYAKGDRLSWPSARKAMPRMRWVANHILSALTRWATGLPVRDSQCGYTAMSRHAAQQLQLETMWPGYGYPNDLLGHLANAGLRVCDVTVRPVYGHERSGIRIHHAVFVVPFVIGRVFARRHRKGFRIAASPPAES